MVKSSTKKSTYLLAVTAGLRVGVVTVPLAEGSILIKPLRADAGKGSIKWRKKVKFNA